MDVSGGGINALLFTLFFAGISSFLLRFFLKYLWTPWAIHGALKKQGFKGPPPRFMLGNLLDIANIMQQELLTDMASVDHNFRKRAFPYLVEWSRRYGEKFVIWFGYEPRIVLTDAEMIRQLLSSKHLNDCGRSPLVQKMVSVLFGRGVFSVNGEQWSHQRRIVAPGFNMEKLKASIDIMSKCTKELVNEWSEITESAGGGHCEIELTKYMDKLTANIILSAEFGMRDGQLGKELFEDLTQLEELMMQSFRFLWMPGSRMYRFHSFEPMDPSMKNEHLSSNLHLTGKVNLKFQACSHPKLSTAFFIGKSKITYRRHTEMVIREMPSITEQFNLKVVDVVFHATPTPDAYGITPLEFRTKMEDFQSYGGILMCFLTGSAAPGEFRVRFETSDDGRSAHEYTISGDRYASSGTGRRVHVFMWTEECNLFRDDKCYNNIAVWTGMVDVKKGWIMMVDKNIDVSEVCKQFIIALS